MLTRMLALFWIAALLWALCVQTQAAEQALRTWTDSTGKHRIVARLVEHADNQVRLQRQDGVYLSVPVAKLSAGDREYLDAQEQPFADGLDAPGDESLPAWEAIGVQRRRYEKANDLSVLPGQRMVAPEEASGVVGFSSLSSASGETISSGSLQLFLRVTLEGAILPEEDVWVTRRKIEDGYYLFPNDFESHLAVLVWFSAPIATRDDRAQAARLLGRFVIRDTKSNQSQKPVAVRHLSGDTKMLLFRDELSTLIDCSIEDGAGNSGNLFSEHLPRAFRRLGLSRSQAVRIHNLVESSQRAAAALQVRHAKAAKAQAGKNEEKARQEWEDRRAALEKSLVGVLTDEQRARYPAVAAEVAAETERRQTAAQQAQSPVPREDTSPYRHVHFNREIP